jgi:high-affinity nickel permease
MTNPTVTTGLNGVSTKILLCSCLYNDAVTFGSTITDTYNKTKTKSIDENRADYIVSRGFVDKFTEKYIEDITKKVFPK